MRRGYSLIEVLVASAIFAGVLIAALTVYSAVNQAGNSSNTRRDVAYAGNSFVNSVVELARYAVPKRDYNNGGKLLCSNAPGGTFKELTCATGLYYDNSSKSLGINIQNTTSTGEIQYWMYQLELSQPSGPYSKDGENYMVYKPILTKYVSPATGNSSTYGSGSADKNIIASDVLLLVSTSDNPFHIKLGTDNTGGSTSLAGNLNLSLDAAQDILAKFLTMKLAFSSTDFINNPTDTAVFPYQTGVSTRSYVSEFIKQ